MIPIIWVSQSLEKLATSSAFSLERGQVEQVIEAPTYLRKLGLVEGFGWVSSAKAGGRRTSGMSLLGIVLLIGGMGTWQQMACLEAKL